MLKQLRIAFLFYVLLFVAAGTYLSEKRSTDWDQTLWVDVYPVSADGTPVTDGYIADLEESRFAPLESFFSTQAASFGLPLDRPFRFMLAPRLDRTLPPIPEEASWLDALVWSLRMRWLAFALEWSSDRPTPDILLFAVYHDPSSTPVIERSTALRKGLIAIANVFASRNMRGSNRVVMAHELLHTLGATDKYDPLTDQPLYPIGYADPERDPLYPQQRAELMAGRRPTAPGESSTPEGLDETMIGPATALEIGWLARLP